MSNQIRYAIHNSTHKIAYIKDVDNGLSCNCNCLKCDERLEAVQGSIREWYFRHNKNINCKGGQETAIHKLAKQIIADNSQINIPGYTITYSNPRQEEAFQAIIPDVTVFSDGYDIHFEIAVTHPVDSLKEIFYKRGCHKSIEIDLKGVPYDITPEELEELVLRTVGNKRKIYWEQEITEQETKEDDSVLHRLLAGLAIILGFILFRNLITKRKRS